MKTMTWPRRLALVNLHSEHSYDLRFREELETRKVLASPRDRSVSFGWDLKTQVCDAVFLDGFEVSVKPKVRGATVSLAIDGYKVVDKKSASAFAPGNRTVFKFQWLRRKHPAKAVLPFPACSIGESLKVDSKRPVGYFCVNGTVIEAFVGLPPGKGDVEIEVKCRTATYTTRPEAV